MKSSPPSAFGLRPSDFDYVDLPWLSGGRTRDGLDCAGLAWLWLHEQMGFAAPCPPSTATIDASLPFRPEPWIRGDVIFFKHAKTGKIIHVAICLGADAQTGAVKFLHILQGCKSRIDNGLTLMRRLGLEPVGALSPFGVQPLGCPHSAELLARALSDPALGWTEVIIIAISLILMAISYALEPSLGNYKRKNNQQLTTQTDPELPLPDLLGSVVVAGNSIYKQLPDTASAQGSPTGQKWNQIVVLGSGPFEEIVYNPDLYIKGISFLDPSWHDGANLQGINLNPPQDKPNAVTGSIGGDSNVPSVTIYPGDPVTSIVSQQDVRLNYDRDFPVYQLSGCGYLVLRQIDATKFSGFNVTVRVKGRKFRQFTSGGFTRTTITNESLTGPDLGNANFRPNASSARFNLANEDIDSVTSLTVNGTAYAEVTATANTGNVYHLNKLKGYIEFLTAPAGGATILITYVYFPRLWSQNPATQLVYLLTEPGRGRGFDESRIDWPSAVDLQTYCDGSVTWIGADCQTVGKRYISNYAVDTRKPLQDHIQAILDSCNARCFFSGGKFYLKALKASDASIFSFNTSNILMDSGGESAFEGDLMDRTSKINRAKVLFHSDLALQAETETIAEDEDNQRARAPRVGNNGIVDDNLKFPAVTTLDQAERLGLMIVTEQVNSNWQYKWTTNIQGLALQPTDVVDLTHPCLPGNGAKVLRIAELNYDENDHLIITATEFVPGAYV